MMTMITMTTMLTGKTGECEDELEGSTHTVGPPTDDPELLELFDGINKSQFSRST